MKFIQKLFSCGTLSHQKIIIGFLPIMLFFGFNNRLTAGEKSHPGKRLGRIHGQVVDETTQRPLPNANIVLTGTQMGAAADTNGYFRIERVPIGSYNVKVLMMGYESRLLLNVIVNPGRTTYLKVELQAKVLQTKAVVATAGYFREAKDAVVSNESLDFEEIRSDPGSVEDVQRVVQALPSVVSGSDQNNEIIVRGGMPGENLFIMDHIEIPNPNHFGFQGTGGGPINMVNTYFIRRVDFYAGAFPVKYGDRASSVMDISLRDGNREHYTGHLYMGMAGAGAMMEGPIARGKGAFILSARKSFLDLIISATGLTAVPKYYDLQGKITYDISPNNRLIIDGIYGNDKISIENEGEGGYSRGAQNVRSLSHQYAVGATLQTLFGRRALSHLTVSQTLNYWNQYVYNDSGVPYYTNLSTEIERTLKENIVFFLNKRLEVNTGGYVKFIPLKYNEWRDSFSIYRYDTSYSPSRKIGVFMTFPVWQRRVRQTTLKLAAYGQFKWFPFPRLTVTTGLRWDYLRYIHKGVVDPRVGLSYNLGKGMKLNLAFGRQSQSPAYIELTSNDENKNLDYKQTKQVVFGLEKLFRPDMRGTVEVFYKDYRRVPVPYSWTTIDPYDRSDGRLVSKGKGFAKGIEFFIQKKMSGNFRLTLSYAYSNSKGFDPRFNNYYNWDYDYHHIFTFIGGVRFNFYKHQWYRSLSGKLMYKIFAWILPLADQVDASIRWRYLGGRPYTKPNYYPNYRWWFVDETVHRNAYRMPPYQRLDFRLDRRFMFNGWNMVTYFEMINVFNRNNIWEYVYNENGTIDRVLQFNVFPVGGLAIEF